ncbi:MAG TPA: formate dehydrogenase accessory protein FdhE [Candidatus Acidoferrales bacterium]|nr:formate dehydrogenase accessory protein FdhE [Candidatus Acidoferrales bacterium]
MTGGSWDERIARAQQLSTTYPFAGEILRFYQRVAGAQAQVYACAHKACGDVRAQRPAGGLREELDLTLLLPEVRGFLGILERYGPAPVSDAARELAREGSAAWVALLTAWWADPGAEASEREQPARFCARAFLEPYAQFLAEHTEPPVIEITPSVCPMCGGKPQFGVLRPEGDGARRSLVCSLCATEWNYGRILCPACGQDSETRLAVYVAEEVKQVRVEACEECRTYIKTVDLSKDGHAVAVVDEIAAVPLDLWARENGYTKLKTNLMGM